MLEPHSVAVVGASARPGSFGERLAIEALRSPGVAEVHLVHPAYDEVLGRPCVPSLADLDGPVDLVLLGVPDKALVEQVSLAAGRGAGGAVVYGAARGLASELVLAADGLALCGPSCMGFVNPARGVRAIGYLEREPLTPGPVALVSHSGSVFSALLRTHRRLEFSLVVSSGQELLTTTADYLGYALELSQTKVVGLFVETMRDVPALRAALSRAAEHDVPVVALVVGSSPVGSALVGAHSGVLAGAQAAWEALFATYGVHQVLDLDEMADTLELFAIGRRVRPAETTRRRGIASVHDSGGERAMTADLAHVVGVPFGALDPATHDRLAAVLDEGLVAGNPLDVWGVGAGTEALFTKCLVALSGDSAVDVTALAVDLVEEYDGDESYPRAVLAAHAATDKPVVVLSTIANAVDQHWAGLLRAAGVPVLEGLPSGLRALGHLRDAATPPPPPVASLLDAVRRARWLPRLAGLDAVGAFDLLADYGLDVARPCAAGTEDEVVAAAAAVGYPVALKTTAAQHKVDVAGVVLDLADEAALASAYGEMRDRLGPEAVVQPMAAGGTELALGVLRDPHLGPLVMLAVGGTLVELVSQRVVALPPLEEARAAAMLEANPVVRQLLDGARGRPPVDRAAVVDALVGLGRLANELGEAIEALDVNPLVCTPHGAVAVDVLLLPAELPGS